MTAKPSFEEGQILVGRYRVEKIIGTGGMGFVVAAHHLHLDKRVALKFILPERASDPVVVERFLIEARAAAKITSEHAVSIFDAATLDDGMPYLVMEFLNGEDLGSALDDRGPLDPSVATGFILQASEALAEAHALGIVHRDLKPANLFLTHRSDGSECIKVLDFGISKLVGAANALTPNATTEKELTKTSHVLGSPPYMSPEQLNSSKHIDHRTDIWALGVTLFELVTNKRPFLGGSLAELCVAIVTKPHADVRALRPDLPDALALVIDRCLAKDASQRFQTLAEMAVALAPIAPAHATPSIERIGRVLGSGGSSSKESANPVSADDPKPPRSSSPQTESIIASRVVTQSIVEKDSIPAPVVATRSSSRRRTPLLAIAILGLVSVGIVVVVVTTIAKSKQSESHTPQQQDSATPVTVASTMTTTTPTQSDSAPLPAPSVLSSTTKTAATYARPASAASTPPSRVDLKGLASDNPFK